MAIRTRSDMHIGLDLILNVLNATPTNRLDPPIKDYFLNMTIANFVKDVINKANRPDENKRVPFRILTYGDILNKYNDIYTLIKEDDSLLPVTPISDNSYYLYNYPSDLFRFETSYSKVCPLNCVTYSAATAPTLTNGGAGSVNIGTHYYFVVFVYADGVSDVNAESVSSIAITGSTATINLSNIPLGSTGCTARRIYRTSANGIWYTAKLVGTIPDNTSTICVDNIADSSLGAVGFNNLNDTVLPNVLLSTYDVASFNLNPFGGKRKYIATTLQTNGIKVYHLGRYSLSKFGMIYIKTPAVLTSSPTTVNCDLPESVHDKIVEDTAKFIAAAVGNGTYEHLLMEAKNKMQ